MTNLDRVEEIAKAVLYEGYMLYPYRPSSVKNRQRWTFGGIFPSDCAKADASLRSTMQTECLLEGDGGTTVEVRVRFLHLLKRDVGRFDAPLAEFVPGACPSVTLVPNIDVGARRFHAWEEAMERTVVAGPLTLDELLGARVLVPFRFAGARVLDPLRAPDGTVPGVMIRTSLPVDGNLILSAKEIAPTIIKLTVVIDNTTPVATADALDRDGAQMRAFASTHTILRAEGGAFFSLLDPPQSLAETAGHCDNQGTWPVLAGEEGARDVILSSPIILYDYPQIAPESPGDLFDATEIDEILTLRILAMTDAEKRDMAEVDERARALLQRTEALSASDLARLHGTRRDTHFATPSAGARAPDPARALDGKPQLAFLHVRGTDLKVGDRVRLSPRASADIMDLVLKDEVAVIEAIERDFEDKVHVAVVLENDPGREFGLDRMPGHRFFFSPDELEAITEEHRP